MRLIDSNALQFERVESLLYVLLKCTVEMYQPILSSFVKTWEENCAIIHVILSLSALPFVAL